MASRIHGQSARPTAYPSPIMVNENDFYRQAKTKSVLLMPQCAVSSCHCAFSLSASSHYFMKEGTRRTAQKVQVCCLIDTRTHETCLRRSFCHQALYELLEQGFQLTACLLSGLCSLHVAMTGSATNGKSYRTLFETPRLGRSDALALKLRFDSPRITVLFPEDLHVLNFRADKGSSLISSCRIPSTQLRPTPNLQVP